MNERTNRAHRGIIFSQLGGINVFESDLKQTFHYLTCRCKTHPQAEPYPETNAETHAETHAHQTHMHTHARAHTDYLCD